MNTDTHYAVTQVASGRDPYSLLEAGFIGPILRFAAGQAVGHAVRKGVQKGASKIDQILSNAEKEAPIATVQKLHALANHPSSKGTPEGLSAARHAQSLATKHGLTLGKDGPQVSKGAVLGRALGQAVKGRGSLWGDTISAFKQGRGDAE